MGNSSHSSFSKMRRFQFLLFLLSSIFSSYVPLLEASQPITKTVTVDPNGHGDFKTIQAAINTVPDNNNQWFKIHIRQGTYREKVTIPIIKGHVILEGEGADKTSVEWNDHYAVDPRFRLNKDASWNTATFLSLAENVILTGIQFKNTYTEPSQPHNAVAALINGDKTSVYGCSFIGIQDTLSDLYGRHYFKDCYIEGIVDFVFGFGQSIYEGCTLQTIPSSEPVGYVTAQGRMKSTDTSGFVFKSCKLRGPAKTYLGRGWRTFARVLFYQTYMDDIVVHQGWDSWQAQYHGMFTTFAESGCSGPGSNSSGRVRWEKTLSDNEVKKLTSISTFINYDGWLDQQPNGYGYTSD